MRKVLIRRVGQFENLYWLADPAAYCGGFAVYLFERKMLLAPTGD
jgi:hypothetical protein